ncbi:MAG TPA: phosphogluconate dehydrogenase C-terminal domain-containing protein [Anaerolineae bacterium]|nr:phosphogluconate dehydrogenase C-terminal domain-containing protein [Anaerolineae bacterium]
MTTIALFGAAGKMGTRISNRLKAAAQYQSLYVEVGDVGIAKLRERGVTPTSPDEAARSADVAILAVPDTILGKVAHSLVPLLKTGAMVICLDPAAPHGNELPARADIAYFITHPCHPPVVSDENDPEVRKDFFGGIKARQNVVCALMQGPEEDYAKGEQIIRVIFAPVMNTYRITVEQMAILEPAMSETTILTCMFVMKEAIDEAVRRGVPKDAAYAFALGHFNINIGILFGYVDAQFSDGAKLAVERAKSQIFQPDWKKVFEPENVMEQVKAITQGRQKA